MFHADQIDDVVIEQTKLTERCPSLDSYLENMGVCKDCLMAVAHAWTANNLPLFVQDIPTEGSSETLAQAMFDVLHDTAASAFVRGYATGLIMGRGDM